MKKSIDNIILIFVFLILSFLVLFFFSIYFNIDIDFFVLPILFFLAYFLFIKRKNVKKEDIIFIILFLFLSFYSLYDLKNSFINKNDSLKNQIENLEKELNQTYYAFLYEKCWNNKECIDFLKTVKSFNYKLVFKQKKCNLNYKKENYIKIPKEFENYIVCEEIHYSNIDL